MDAAARFQTASETGREPAQSVRVEMWDNDKLLGDPPMFHRVMQQALNRGDAHLLESLLAAYRRLPEPDALLLAHAEAELLCLRGDTGAAVKRYEDLQRNYPDDVRIRLDAAAALVQDRQWREADALFASTLNEPGLPENVAGNVNVFRQGIRRHNQWQFSGNLGFARHQNINDEAPSYCTPLGCTQSRPVDAWGLDYSVEAAKNTPIKGHHNVLIRTYIGGTSYYFDRKSQYDRAFGRIYSGWQYQSAKDTVSVLPFYQLQFAGSNEFADKTTRERGLPDLFARGRGIQTAWSRLLHPRLQSRLGAEMSVQRYVPQERRRPYDGRHYALNAALTYAPTNNHTVYGGWGGGVFRPRHQIVNGAHNNQAYVRHTVSAGWNARWPQLGGLESSVRGSYTWRRYSGTALDADFIHRQRENREYDLRLTLAHRNIRFAGLMPQLVYERNITNSTHDWADRKSRGIFVEVVKPF
ncbi:surface lipoprotein assembly modifier [Neisseria leonii]|uniref:surface lipoprotein assembly modifier n=1 Tax=Neisseria leonii TaxID=2995413 RepID=UPI0030CBABED